MGSKMIMYIRKGVMRIFLFMGQEAGKQMNKLQMVAYRAPSWHAASWRKETGAPVTPSMSFLCLRKLRRIPKQEDSEMSVVHCQSHWQLAATGLW